MTENLAAAYLDDEEYLMFKEQYLEEKSKSQIAPAIQATDNALTELLKKLLDEKNQKSKVENLGKIAKNFMIEKFDGKNANACQWIKEFEKECERNLIIEDKKKIEILKNFLEGSSADWYTSMVLKFSVQSQWKTWRDNFCETFGNKGWSSIRYAYLFKYQGGSLLDYALKKEKLLLQINKGMDQDTLMNLIAIGLPDFVSDKIDRET